MASTPRKLPENDEVVRSLFSEILSRIRTDEDPVTLNAYRGLVRKNVPFFLRSYFAAYLFKQLHSAAPDASSGRGRKRGDRERQARPDKQGRNDAGRSRGKPVADGPSREDRKPEPRREPELRREPEPRREPLSEDIASTLFFSAGRNRRAYARELLSLIETEAMVDRSAIGELRVLDNFSFVQVKKEVADDVISALNGFAFRGRPLSVSYAKPRRSDDRHEASSPGSYREDDREYGNDSGSGPASEEDYVEGETPMDDLANDALPAEDQGDESAMSDDEAAAPDPDESGRVE